MKLTTERLKKLIKEELNKMNESNDLLARMLTMGPLMGYIAHKASSSTSDNPEKVPMKQNPAEAERYNQEWLEKQDAIEKRKFQQADKERRKALPGEIEKQLKDVGFIVTSVRDGQVKLKAIGGSGKSGEFFAEINYDLPLDKAVANIIDQIKEKDPNAAMAASKRRLGTTTDRVVVDDPLMERKTKGECYGK